jgi:cyclic pyranopterin phosphate synthase
MAPDSPTSPAAVVPSPAHDLIDAYQRHINYIRVSITDRCNLACSYCMPRDRVPKLHHRDILRYEEILRVLAVGARMGIKKVRVTGGEPLVRKGVIDFLGKVVAVSNVAEVALTTNAVLLKPNVERLARIGIRRINVSLDSLDRQTFKFITGSDLLPAVWEGILQAHQVGFAPIKLNMVAMKGVNDNEIEAFGRLTYSYPFHVRFIEVMPIGKRRTDAHALLLTPEIRRQLERRLGPLLPVPARAGDGPARRYRLKGAVGEIGFISAISRHFCADCNRLRLTASGQLRPCLLSDHQVDLKGPMRAGCSDDDIRAIILQTVRDKQSAHRLGRGLGPDICGQMSAIGG